MNGKLIEEMAKAGFHGKEKRTKKSIGVWNSFAKLIFIPIAELMLSVVREYPHLVAEVCIECDGDGWSKQLWGCKEKCKVCKGHGVVAKGKI